MLTHIEVIFTFVLAIFVWPFVNNFFATFGILVFLNLIAHEFYQYAEAIYAKVIGAFTLKNRLKSYGTWAIITGCAKGMGREYCFHLAKSGLNLILMDRMHLDELSQELREKYPIQTVSIIVDFSNQDPAMYEDIKSKLSAVKGEIGILVNNVGMFYKAPIYFHEADEKDILNMMAVNMVPHVMISHMVIKDHMLPRNKGLVVFIGSTSSIRTTPFFNVYAATKSFIEFISKILHEEYRNTGVYVQLIQPGIVATELGAYATSTPTFDIPNAKNFVESAVPTFGMTPSTSAYPWHIFQTLLARATPDWLFLYAYRSKLDHFRIRNMKPKAE